MRFAMYGRKSIYSDKSDSVDNQERMCREYVDLRFQDKAESFGTYSDEGATGANTNRPGLKRLLADVDNTEGHCLYMAGHVFFIFTEVSICTISPALMRPPAAGILP